MADYLWACWDGGGNLTPSLGIARELVDRGHRVEFVGRPEMLPRVGAEGLEATALDGAAAAPDRYAFHPLAPVFGYTSSPVMGDGVAAAVAERDPDVVVVDAMFSAALDVAPGFGRPTAVALHTFFDRLFPQWEANMAMQGASRVEAGFDGLPGIDILWGERDLLVVNALEALDGPDVTDWSHVVHGAPVLASESRAVPCPLEWDAADPTPLVLLSFSTVTEQRSVEKLQAALDALAPMPVHVVATTGGIVDPDELAPPANARVLPFADHDALLDCADLAVGHGGHGTTMRCLSRGVPIAAIPAKALDQAPIAALLEEWGAGIALPGDAGVDHIRSAVERILDEPGFTSTAQELAGLFAGPDGAVPAADALEELAAR